MYDIVCMYVCMYVCMNDIVCMYVCNEHVSNSVSLNTAVTHQGSTLQLPFLVFGLGETPNFIEDLTVGAAQARGTSYQQWTSLIPNSQIIVITRPPNNAKK